MPGTQGFADSLWWLGLHGQPTWKQAVMLASVARHKCHETSAVAISYAIGSFTAAAPTVAQCARSIVLPSTAWDCIGYLVSHSNAQAIKVRPCEAM